EGVLGKVDYLEHISPKRMLLFHLTEKNMHVIDINMENDVDLTTSEGFQWLRENLMDDAVEFLQANKTYSEDKNLDKFELIKQGAVITKGDLFRFFNDLVN
ncbi:MAG: hypothetical protein KDD13_04710, partial [Mangrovimonas sp.]|nr:hypothetical protein [Mangrovimonas sp.]